MSTDTKLSADDTDTVQSIAEDTDIEPSYIKKSIEFQNADREFTNQTRQNHHKNQSSISDVLVEFFVEILDVLFYLSAVYPSQADVTEWTYNETHNTISLRFDPHSDVDVVPVSKQFNLNNELDRKSLRRLLQYLRLPKSNPSTLANATVPIKTYRMENGSAELHSKIHIPPVPIGLLPIYLHERICARLTLYSISPTIPNSTVTNRRYYLTGTIICFGSIFVAITIFNPSNIRTLFSVTLVSVFGGFSALLYFSSVFRITCTKLTNTLFTTQQH